MSLLKCTFYFVTILLSIVNADKPCARHRTRIKHQFHALRHCQRSNRTIVGLTNAATVGECAEYARKKRGLAFNYGPKGRNQTNLFDLVQRAKEANQTGPSFVKPPKGSDAITVEAEEFYNCQVLDCPEYRNLSTIVNDTRFDYYSLYTRLAPSANATCIPSIGMFILDDRKLNYSLAFNECRSLGGSLSHVASEGRTNQLARLLSGTGGGTTRNSSTNVTELAFVGLNETVKGKFFTSASEPLDCFLYRAWAPEHPSKTRQPGCVALASNSSWTVQKCTQHLQFICELHTSGPPLYEARLKRKCSLKRPNNRIAPTRRSVIQSNP